MTLRAISSPVLAILLALGASTFLATVPASAATNAPAQPTATYVDYAGTEVVTVPAYPEVHADVLASKARIDCSSYPCVLTISIDDSEDGFPNVDMTQGLRLEIVNGHAHYDMPAFGDQCGDIWLSSGPMDITATATGLTGTRSANEGGIVTCSDQTTVEYPGYVVNFTLAFAGGDPCVLDNSCFPPTPTPAPLAGAVSTVAGAQARGLQPPRTSSTASVLSALPTVATAVTVRNSIWAAAAAVILVLLVSLPTHFFNQAAGKASELVETWWKKRRARRTTKPVRPLPLGRWPFAVAGVVAASIISAFVDPHFGFDFASARTFLSILVSLIVDVAIGWVALLLIVRKTHPAAVAKFEFKPLTLLIVVAAVLFTRLTSFQPGIVFGLVAGVAFGGLLATADKARVAIIGLAWSFGLGILAWIGYSVLAWTAGDKPGAVAVFVRETLSGVAIAGGSSLPIALLPLRGLTGAKVWAWKKWVWALCYGIGLFAFFVMLMPMPFSWQSVPINLIVWIAAYLAYALVAVGLWVVITRPWKKEPAEA
ncbi:MAG: hypothetical protein JWO10_1009 [Microbacteriaceae bacterium]|nr:hypothetical protein [Microbacteriaceae bacterium]